MKKIFRMALVFALAGATLMYTGCSKDYTEDINNVNADVKDLQNKLGDLNNEVSALKSSISSLEAAYKAADDLIKGDVSDLKSKVTELEKAVKDLSKYATKDQLNEAVAGVEKKITDAKAEIKATTDGLQAQINELKEKLAADEEALKKLQEAQKEVDNVYGFLSDELRAIVFQPDFYLGGVEATSYDFASFQGLTLNKLKADSKPLTVKVDTATTTVIFLKDEPTTFSRLSVKDSKTGKVSYPDDKTQGQLGLATYDLNPSSFPVDSAEWAMIGRDVPYIVKSAPAKDWSVVVNEVTKNEANQERGQPGRGQLLHCKSREVLLHHPWCIPGDAC